MNKEKQNFYLSKKTHDISIKDFHNFESVWRMNSTVRHIECVIAGLGLVDFLH